MIRFLLFLLAVVLFLGAGLDLISTHINGLRPAALVAFGLASLTLALTPEPPPRG